MRDNNDWTAFTSLDGHTWQQAGAPMGAPFLGAWLGLYATANGGNKLRAVFDYVSGFAPDTFVDIGAGGTGSKRGGHAHKKGQG